MTQYHHLGPTRPMCIPAEMPGHNPGNTDGDVDLNTRIAIGQLEARVGRPPTGKAAPILLGIFSAGVDKGR